MIYFYFLPNGNLTLLNSTRKATSVNLLRRRLVHDYGSPGQRRQLVYVILSVCNKHGEADRMLWEATSTFSDHSPWQPHRGHRSRARCEHNGISIRACDCAATRAHPGWSLVTDSKGYVAIRREVSSCFPFHFRALCAKTIRGYDY
jgi:hypothetical protein